MNWETIAVLGASAFAAGCVDAIVGGGGLIQLPALLLGLPQVPVAVVFGTNKLASIAGTSVAVVQYGRRVALPWRSLSGGVLAAAIGSFAGARSVGLLPPEVLRSLILVLLLAVGTYTALKRDFGLAAGQRRSFLGEWGRWLGIGGGLGFYDGFFGPGTGSFLIFAGVSWLRFDFLTASASAKVLNWVTNFAALVAFVTQGQVLYEVALPMAACNIAGAIVGTRLAILKGNRWIRWLFLLIVIALVARLTWDMVRLWGR